MFELVAIVAVAVPAVAVAGGVWWITARLRALHHQRLTECAAEFGLQVEDGAWLRPATASGVIEGRPVVIDTVQRGSGKSSKLHSRVVVRLPLRVGLGREGVWSPLASAVHGDHVQVGDAPFDGRVQVRGDPVEASALLDVDTRAEVAACVRDGCFVDREGLCFEQRGYFPSTEAMSRRVRQLVSLARRLDRPLTPAAAWRVASTDPVPGVRARATRHLLDAFERGPADHGVLEAMALAVTDPADLVRVAVLRRDVGALRGLLASDRPGVARTAAVALARGAPGPDRALEAALLEALGDGRLDVIEALAAVGSAAAVPRLRALADRVLVLDGSASAAREAIRTIQARAGAEHGGLALADVTGGEVSTADAGHRGALSAGRLPQSGS